MIEEKLLILLLDELSIELSFTREQRDGANALKAAIIKKIAERSQ